MSTDIAVRDQNDQSKYPDISVSVLALTGVLSKSGNIDATFLLNSSFLFSRSFCCFSISGKYLSAWNARF